MVHALHSRRVITPHGERDAAVVIDGEHIAAIHPIAELSASIPCEDLGNLALLPGLIDVHTHINEPGRTEWEGFATATRAAAAGGFTTLIDMPLNCLPETTDVTALELKREAVSTGGPNGTNQALVDYALWGGAVDANQHNLEPLALAGVPGFKAFLIYPGCDGFTAIDRTNLELAIPAIARTGLPLLVHAELDTAINAAFEHLNATNADWRKYSTYLASRPDEAELEAIELLLNLCRQHRFRLHIVHLSTAKALPLIAAAKHEGLPVTVETCPHYLHCAAEDIPNGATLFKCAPPIRTRANRELLWTALVDGAIDLIATDHSPCPPEMKRLTPSTPGEEAGRLGSGRLASGRFDEAWGGIPSLSTAVSVLWTECTRRELTLSQLAQWTSAAPARLAGLATHVGSIEPGKHANLIAFDPEDLFTLTEDRLHYRHKISPYLGDQRIFTRTPTGDTFPTTPTGREYALSYPLT
jgi:allantoinase